MIVWHRIFDEVNGIIVASQQSLIHCGCRDIQNTELVLHSLSSVCLRGRNLPVFMLLYLLWLLI